MELEEIKQDSQVSTDSSEPELKAGGEATTTEPAQDKSIGEKIREKGSVAPPASVVAQGAAAVAEYKANYKFKAAGKEMEVPEFLRGVIKDQETEKYLHSVLSKAHGIEMVQQKLHSVREEREHVRQAYQQVMEPIQEAREAYQRDDLDTVFGTLKIDPNKVLQWAYKKVELSQMPPDQRQIYEARTQAEKRAWELEKQNIQYQQQSVQMQSEQISQMLEVVLERPDYSAVAQAYDGRKGTPGAFRNLVIQIGDQEFHRTGKVITPMDAAKAAVDLLGEKLQAPGQQPAAAMQQQVVNPMPATNAPQRKVTLPNAGGSKSSSPAKSKVSSLDDLRKIHQKMAQN